MAPTTSKGSLFISTMSALSIATSVPAPIAKPTSAWVKAGASFTPSPTIPTFLSCAWSSLTLLALSPGSTSANTLSIPRLALGSSLIVSGQHGDLDATRAEHFNRFHRGRSYGIGDGDQTHELAVHCKVNDRSSGALQSLRFLTKLAEVDLVLRHQKLIAEQCRFAVDLGLRALAFEVFETGRLGRPHGC